MRVPVIAVLGLALGAGCSPRLMVQTVSGHGGTVIPGVQVQVDDGAWETTDGLGWVTFPQPAGPYVLRVHQVRELESSRADEVWVWQSPEGSRLVLPVDSSGLRRSSALVFGSYPWGTGPGPTRIYASTGPGEPMPSTDAFFTWSLGLSWEQPRPLRSVLRAIAATGSPLPSHFIGYGEIEVGIAEGRNTTIDGISLPADRAIGEGTVEGVVSVPPELSGMDVTVETSLDFPDQGILELGRGDVPDPFAVTFPKLSGSESWITVTAAGGGAGSLDAQRVQVPSSGVAFEPPGLVDLVSPADGADIDASTTFRWTGGPAGGQTRLSVFCTWTDEAGKNRGAFYWVESAGAEASLPSIPGVDVPAGAACPWQVSWSLSEALSAAGAGAYRASLTAQRAATFR